MSKQQSDMVTIETMPDCHRASHRAARNWGQYPANGAQRTRMPRDEAESIVEADPDGYDHIVVGKQRTITLTGRPPVKIDEEEWPQIAYCDERPGSSRNGTPVPDYETDRHTIRVRQHADGRAIVYAVLDASTAWTGSQDRRGGELIPADGNVADAIRRVGEDCNIRDSVIRDCIADLPAEEL